MDFSLTCFILTSLIYLASLLRVFINRYSGNRFKKAFRAVNWISLSLTIILLILWAFNIHLRDIEVEHIPFWIFLCSSLVLYGFTRTNWFEKIFYGVIFWGHLFLSLFLFCGLIGVALFTWIYSPFWPDVTLYEDDGIIITDQSGGVLSIKPSPTIYLKQGLFSHKFSTKADPIFNVDSVRLSKQQGQILVKIYEDTTVTELLIDHLLK